MSDSISINLEHLRKQAKALLKECRAGDVSALERVRAQLPRLLKIDLCDIAAQIKLADVQQVLAREQGHANWGELKMHDSPVARLLAAVRSGSLSSMQRELESFPKLKQESIHAACAIGDADAVRFHLLRDPQLIHSEQAGWPPLLYACASRLHGLGERHAAGLLECATLLLDRGADPNTSTQPDSANTNTVSAADRAGMAGNRPVLLLLLQRGAARDSGAIKTLGMWDANPGGPSIYEAFAHLFNEPGFIKEEAKRLRVVYAQHTEWFQKMKARKEASDPEQFYSHLLPSDFYESNLPVSLAQESHLAKWELLVEHGINPNWTNAQGESPLHHAAMWRGTAASAELFLAHGADPNLRRSDGKTPYFLAVSAGNKAVADALRAHGADTSSVPPLDKFLGACLAVDSDAAWTVVRSHPEVLSTAGAQGRALFVKAAGDNRLDQVRLMSEIGFDVGAVDSSGATALHVAAWNGHREMVQLLLQFRAPVNLRDATFGTSPLAWAAHGSRNCRNADEEYCSVVERLFEAGADYDRAISPWGVRPEDIASPNVAEVLRTGG